MISENKSLFSLEALKTEGVKTNRIGMVRLLCDADVLFLAKQSYDESDAVKEYYSRDLRRHPVWKSEAEFSLLFDFNKNKKFVEILQKWEDITLSGEYGVYSINDEFYKKLKQEAERLADIKAESSEKQSQTLLNRIAKINQELILLDEIKKYFDSNDIPFDFVIISLKKFKSNIYKESFKKLPIVFSPLANHSVEMQEVTHLPLDTAENKNFFYLYYKRKQDHVLDVQEFSKMLQRAAVM